MENRKSLLRLTENHKTPFYIYNGNVIEDQFLKLKKAFSNTSKLQINYAVKALSTVAILKFIKNLGVFVDTVSINEVKLALTAGFNKEEIFYTPNGASFKEILEVYKLGIHVTLDNLIQIEQLAKLNTQKAIAIRINPNIKAGGNKKIRVAKKNSKFGLSLNDIENLKNIVQQYHLKIDGFHIHLGSDILATETFKNAASILFKTAKQFKDLKFINFGGGFKVKYSENDDFMDINDIGMTLCNAFNQFKMDYDKDLTLVIEPGKFLVSNSGNFLCKITTIKDQNVFVNSGFNHLIRPMYYDAFHQIHNISNEIKIEEKFNIVGNICEQDYFGKKRTINKPHIGDLICIENAGAYCFTMASNYNSRLRPLELFYYNGETKVIRKKEVFEDLLRNQIY